MASAPTKALHIIFGILQSLSVGYSTFLYDTIQYQWSEYLPNGADMNDTLLIDAPYPLISFTVDDLLLTIETDGEGPISLLIDNENRSSDVISLSYHDPDDWNEIKYFTQTPPPFMTDQSVNTFDTDNTDRRNLITVSKHKQTGWTGYLVGPKYMRYTEAERYCRHKGHRSLVSIHSWRQNYEVWKQCRRTRFRCWIGLNDRGRESHWRWSDSTRVNFRAWSRGEPNDWGRGEDCVQMWGNRRWNDISCNARLRPICNRAFRRGPPPIRDSYWNRRYKRVGRFIAVFPGRPWGWWRRHRSTVAWTYNQCSHFCVTHFGGLASIRTQTENNEVNHACNHILYSPKARNRREHPGDYRGYSCWIGLRERKKYGVTKWMDNTDVKFKKWWRGHSKYWKHDQEHKNRKHRHLMAEGRRLPREWYSDYGRHRGVEIIPRHGGRWRERRCFEKKACVCQMPRGQVHGNYIGISATKTYRQAERYCYKHYGTTLATIKNEAENQAVMRACRGVMQPNSVRHCWIGYESLERFENVRYHVKLS